MKLKWYGTASVLLEKDGTRLLFDPFISLNNRTFKPSLEELAAADSILVTHGHIDHIIDIPGILKHNCGKTAVYCTAKPKETLISMGVKKECIQLIKPGDILNLEPFEIRVLKGRHIVFDKLQVIKTFLNPRMLVYRNNLKYIIKNHKKCREAGEIVVYDISVKDKRILLLGSLNLDDKTTYPKEADLLILPLQGRSDINKYAMRIIDLLQPKKVMLDHFDDTFPPISSYVKTGPFISLMQKKYPGVPVICPQAGSEWIEAIQ